MGLKNFVREWLALDEELELLRQIDANVSKLLEILGPPQPPPPPPPGKEIPEWVGKYGDLGRWTPMYAREDLKAFYEVIEDQASVFFSDPDQLYTVEHPDGGVAWKNVFEARTSEEQPVLLNIEFGKVVVGYRHMIPTVATSGGPRQLADGEVKIEICSPRGGIVRPGFVKLVGWIDSSGWWHEGG